MQSLADAITAVEQAEAAYQSAATQTQADLDAASAQQTKLDAAKSTVTTDVAAQATSASAEVAALQILAQVVTDLIASRTPAP